MPSLTQRQPPVRQEYRIHRVTLWQLSSHSINNTQYPRLRSLASRSAASVSSVSPDWEIAMKRVLSSISVSLCISLEFRSHVYFNRNVSQFLNYHLADKPCMVCSSAGNDVDLVYVIDIFLCHGDVIKSDAVIRVQSAHQSFSDHLWLFRYFLQHEMFILSLVCSVSLPVNNKYFPVDLVSILVIYRDVILCQYNGFIVFDEIYIMYILQQQVCLTL